MFTVFTFIVTSSALGHYSLIASVGLTCFLIKEKTEVLRVDSAIIRKSSVLPLTICIHPGISQMFAESLALVPSGAT